MQQILVYTCTYPGLHNLVVSNLESVHKIMVIPTHPSNIELTGKLLLHMLVCGHVVIHVWKIDCIEKLKVFLDFQWLLSWLLHQ